MSYDTVLELPLKVFTLYNTNINRLRAEEDLRLLQVTISGASHEGYVKLSEILNKEKGEPIQLEHTMKDHYVPMEEGAIEKLKGLQSG